MQPDQPAAQKPSMIKINPDDVHFVASLVHGFENAPTFIFESRVYPFRRGPYDAWVFQYPDGSRCAVQVPIHMQNRPRTETESLIEHEVANLEKLAQAQFAWSPRPISYSATFANHLRYPYIITTWIDGRPLEWTDTVPEIPQRGLVLQQLAGILFELVQCTLQPESDPSITADRFLRDKIDKKMMQVIRNQTKELTIPDCMALRLLARQISIIPSEIYPNNDPNVPNEPCAVAASALAHDDLCASNILIDDNYRITGIINWSKTRRLPIRYALKLPRFLTIDPNPNDNANESLDEFISRYTQPSENLRRERTYFAACLCLVIMARAPGSEIASAAPLCADSEDLDWKHLILSSVLSTKLHQWMAGKLYLMKGTAPYERSLKSQSWDWFIQKEVVAFCDCHLLDYGTDARRKRAIKVLEEAFLMRRGWDWIGKWLSFQFTKRSD